MIHTDMFHDLLTSSRLKIILIAMRNTDDNHIVILLEEIRDQNKALLEGMKDLPTCKEFNELKHTVDSIEGNVRIIKAVVTDQSKQLQDHEHRIGGLETAR